MDALRHVEAPLRLDRLGFIHSDRFDRAYRLSIYKLGANAKYIAELRSTYQRTFSFFSDGAGLALATRYAERHPSSTLRPADSLTHFPAFLARQTLARGRAYLVELARFELAETRSWYNKDVAAPPRCVDGLVLQPRVSFHVSRFALFNPRAKVVLTYRDGLAVPRRRRQVLAILRGETGVTVVEVSVAELAFLRARWRTLLPPSLRVGPRVHSGSARGSLARKGILGRSAGTGSIEVADVVELRL